MNMHELVITKDGAPILRRNAKPRNGQIPECWKLYTQDSDEPMEDSTECGLAGWLSASGFALSDELSIPIMISFGEDGNMMLKPVPNDRICARCGHYERDHSLLRWHVCLRDCKCDAFEPIDADGWL